jgi:hypothetical protein
MNLFLAELGQAVAPGTHGIVLMDKAGWHTSGDLVVRKTLVWSSCRPTRLNSIRPSGYGCTSEKIASRTAFSRPPARSSTPVVTLGIGYSAKPDAFDPYVLIPGSNGSATNQASISREFFPYANPPAAVVGGMREFGKPRPTLRSQDAIRLLKIFDTSCRTRDCLPERRENLAARRLA